MSDSLKETLQRERICVIPGSLTFARVPRFSSDKLSGHYM